MLMEEIDSDIGLLANELGVNINEVRERRKAQLLKEYNEIHERQHAEQAARKKAYEDSLIQHFKDHYTETFLLTVNGNRFKSVDDNLLCCSGCGSSIHSLRTSILEAAEFHRGILKYGATETRTSMPILRGSQTCLKCNRSYSYMIQVLL